MNELREDLLNFLDSYVTMKTLSTEDVSRRPRYNVKNVIDMDIVELICETRFGELNLEICHYLKNRKNSDGMTVKFRFKSDVHPGIKSKVRGAIFRKDVSNYQDKFEEIELISLQIDTIKEFTDFFIANIMDEDNQRKSVRSFIK